MLIYDGCLPIMAYVLASVGIRWHPLAAPWAHQGGWYALR